MGSQVAIVVTAWAAGLLAGLALAVWQRAPPFQRWYAAVAIAIVAGAVCSAALGGAAPAAGVWVWGMGPYVAVLCWRLVQDRYPLSPRHVALVMAALLPGWVLGVRTFPPGGPTDPAVWIGPDATIHSSSLMLGHVLGPMLLTVAAIARAWAFEAYLRPRKLALAAAGGMGALGLATAGVWLTRAPDLVRWILAPTMVLIAGLIVWGVMDGNFWRPVSGSVHRAATAAFMTRIVGRSTERLGRELAIAQAHARKMEQRFPAEDKSELQGLVGALRRGQQLAGSLTVGSEQNAPQRSMVDVSKLVEQAIRLVGNGDPSFAKLTRKDDLPPIWAVDTALEQAVIALIRNALDAQRMVKASSPVLVRIEDALQPYGVPDLVVGQLQHEQYVRVIVEDSGDGLSPEVRERCLEPFFSTRSGREGLGLFSVLNLARLDGAAMELNSRPGATRAVLWLPIRAVPIQLVERATVTGQMVPAGTEDDIVFIVADALRQEKFALISEARGLRWSVVGSMEALLTQPVDVRNDGVVVCLDDLQKSEVARLARWLSSRLVSAVGTPQTVAALVSAGVDPQSTYAFADSRARSVMSSVEVALSETRT